MYNVHIRINYDRDVITCKAFIKELKSYEGYKLENIRNYFHMKY